MRLPLGFGKKGYFTLASIQAATIECTTKRHQTRLYHTARLVDDLHDEELSEDDPPSSLIIAFCQTLSFYRPRLCICSRLFASRAHSAIKRSQIKRKCNCRCPSFSFRRSGIHPPILSIFTRQTSKARSTTFATMALKLVNIVGRV